MKVEHLSSYTLVCSICEAWITVESRNELSAAWTAHLKDGCKPKCD